GATTSEPRPTISFAAISAALGLSPLVIGNAVGLAAPYEYYAFTAAPWLALLLARANASLPRAMATARVGAPAGWDALALGYRAPDLSSEDSWRFHNWDWPDVVRLSAVSRRLSDDVRENMAARPESVIVLYCDMPSGCYFQTEDGPATRESL